MTSNTSEVSLIPRTHLFGNPARMAVRISADGQFLSWLAPLKGVLNVWTASLDDPASARAVTSDTGHGIRNYGWTYDGKIVYLQDINGNEEFHIYAVDPRTQTSRDLTPFDGLTARLEGISRIVRDRILVGLNRRDPKYFDLYTLDISTGALDLVEQNTDFAGFIVDDHYRPHFAVRFPNDGTRQIFERDHNGGWTEWMKFSAEDARTSGPTHLNHEGNVLFMLDSRGRDTAALVQLKLTTGESRVIATDPRVDITDTIVDLYTGEPVAYSINVERRAYFALKSHVQLDIDFLNGRGLDEWSLVSRSEDDTLWIVIGISDVRSATAYLYDRPHRSLRLLFEFRPELAGSPLVKMQPLIIPSRDGFDLVSYLSRPAGETGTGPLVLLIHGGPWMRDTFGFQPYHQWLTNRGYSVLSVNFRGSAGFGKAFLNAGDKEWGRRMDDDLLDAVKWAVGCGVADPARIAVMGTSYGGYAVLASMTRNPDTYACGIDIVGPANLETLVLNTPPYWAAAYNQLIRAVGDPATEEGRILLKERSPVHRANRICKPLLIGQGANDPRVKRSESDQMVEAMKANGIPVTYVLFPDEGHGFARPENSMAFNAIVEAFLELHLGGRAEPMSEAELTRSSGQILEGGNWMNSLRERC
jgi:dipeptidyl aminopeptidase/acylaminoacyl peptidase